MSKFWNPLVQNLTPYTPGEQPKLKNLIKLNTNENPFPPSAKVLTVLQEAVSDDLKLYPDPTAEQLKIAIGQYFNVQTKQVFVGNGSDEVLAHTFHALLKHDLPLLFPDITYSFYPVYCGLYGIDSIPIPLTNNYTICIDDYLRPNGGIIFPNPNAPTGCLLSLTDIKRLLKANTESVVVIDEAYIDFGGQSAVTLVDQFPNLLVIQTLSKSRSLAGLRVGFAIGNAALIEALERIKNSFNSYPLGRLAIAGAIMALEDQEYFENTCRTIILNRERLIRSMSALGFKILPSSANFIFARHPDWKAGELVAALRAKHIIVRHFKQPRIEQFMRITIGTELECQTLIQALRSILNQC